jgi:hypothetical protein
VRLSDYLLRKTAHDGGRTRTVSFVDEEADSLTADSPEPWLTIRNGSQYKALVRVLAYSGVEGRRSSLIRRTTATAETD